MLLHYCMTSEYYKQISAWSDEYEILKYLKLNRKKCIPYYIPKFLDMYFSFNNKHIIIQKSICIFEELNITLSHQ